MNSVVVVLPEPTPEDEFNLNFEAVTAQVQAAMIAYDECDFTAYRQLMRGLSEVAPILLRVQAL